MKSCSATLIHMSISRGGTYHDGTTAHHHRASNGIINDMATTTLRCAPFCGQVLRVRLRTRRELWQLRRRRFLLAISSIAAGAMVAIGGGITGAPFVIAVTSVMGLAAYITGVVFLFRIFARSARYILTNADGSKVLSTDHRIVLGP
jgi:hypothetical protein